MVENDPKTPFLKGIFIAEFTATALEDDFYHIIYLELTVKQTPPYE